MREANSGNERSQSDSTIKSVLNVRVLTKQILGYVPGRVLPAFIYLASISIYTRIFGADAFGRYALVLSIIMVVVGLFSQWLQQSINRFIPSQLSDQKLEENKRTIAAGFLAVGLAVIALSLIAVPAAWYIVPGEWEPFIVPAVLTCLGLSIFNPLAVLLQAEMKVRSYSVIKLLEAVFRLGFALLIIFLVLYNSSSIFLGMAAACFVLIPFLWSIGRMPPVKLLLSGTFVRAEVEKLKYFAAYGFPMIGWFLAAQLLNFGDRFIIQIFRGAAEVGVYSANYQLIQGAVGLIATPIILAAYPFLMKSWSAEDKERTGSWLGGIADLFSVLGIIMFGAAVLLSADFADWLLGSEFFEGHFIMPVILLGFLFWQLGMYAHKPLEFAEETKLMFKVSMLIVVVNVVLNVIFVPFYGYAAAAYTTLASFFLYFAVVGAKGRKIVWWTLSKKLLIITGGLTFLLTAVLHFVRSDLEALVGYWWCIGIIAALYTVFAALALGRQVLHLARND